MRINLVVPFTIPRIQTKDANIHIWKETEHPRGKPENAGEFTSKSSSSNKKTNSETNSQNNTLLPKQILRGKSGYGTNVKVILNPDQDDMLNMLDSEGEVVGGGKGIRAVAFSNGNIAIGDSYNIIHADVRRLSKKEHPELPGNGRNWVIATRWEKGAKTYNLQGKRVTVFKIQGGQIGATLLYPEPKEWPSGLRKAFGL